MAWTQAVIQCGAFAQADKQNHTNIALPFLADHDGFLNLGEALDLAVDFRRADPHPARIERRIGAAIDHITAIFRLADEIAMIPDIVKLFEIGGLIAGIIRVIPESNRHGGEGAGADQFAFLT